MARRAARGGQRRCSATRGGETPGQADARARPRPASLGALGAEAARAAAVDDAAVLSSAGRGGARTFFGIVALNRNTWRSGRTWPISERTCGLAGGEGEGREPAVDTQLQLPGCAVRARSTWAAPPEPPGLRRPLGPHGLLCVGCAGRPLCAACAERAVRTACAARAVGSPLPLTWGSNPMSNMTYVTRAMVQAFILIKSAMRPGVATAAWPAARRAEAGRWGRQRA